MSGFTDIGVEKHGHVTLIEIRRPPLNFFDLSLIGQIADALEEHLAPVGWGVLVRAQHLCMCARGVRAPGSEMVTSSVGGVFRVGGSTRDEFLRLVGV